MRRDRRQQKEMSPQGPVRGAARAWLERGAEAAPGQADVEGVELLSPARIPAASVGPGMTSPGLQRASEVVGG